MSEAALTENRRARLRKKLRVDVNIIMNDGTNLSGSVFIGPDERVLDLMNDNRSFFPLMLEDEEILLLNKSAVAVCKPLDIPG